MHHAKLMVNHKEGLIIGTTFYLSEGLPTTLTRLTADFVGVASDLIARCLNWPIEIYQNGSRGKKQNGARHQTLMNDEGNNYCETTYARKRTHKPFST
jgi:hypothetical protein